MRKVSLRRLLSKLTVLAVASSPAASSASTPPPEPPTLDDGDLAADLPIDREQLALGDAASLLASGLAHALGEMRPLAATELAASWALSEDALRRAALAHALEWTFPLVCDGTVIDHLSRDPEPTIRAACARAARLRRATGGDQGVLARLARDPDPSVRAIASRA